MSMRKQFIKTTEQVLSANKNVILLLGDIGVFGFRKAFSDFPERVYNIGILEQATIGVAAGMAADGLVPIVHTIAPFLVERCYEQLKVDFCYQKLGGNFVSVGASYDYSALGCTHHCPADVGILKYLPGMEIIVPGTSEEFNVLFQQCFNNGNPSYYRLSEHENNQSQDVNFGKATLVKEGSKATVIAVGPILNQAIAAVKKIDVTLLYYTTVEPFDVETLRKYCKNGKVFVIEPFYSGALTNDIMQALQPMSVNISGVGIPIEFLRNYGSKSEHDKVLCFTKNNIEKKIKEFIK